MLLLSQAPAFAQDVPIDSDGDGISDEAEDANGNKALDGTETDPRNADTDRGGEADGQEVKGGRNPLDRSDDMTFDQDGDGLTNGEENVKGTNPKASDSDSDGATDFNDPFPLDDTYKSDADKDRLPDEWEKTFGLAATGSPDTEVDQDGDGLSNLEEFLEGTSPLSNDSDRDGVTDGQELERGTDPGESACLSYKTDAAPFQDMTSHWARPSVETLQRTLVAPYAQPILRGYPTQQGNFEFLPNRPVTRYELLKMALFSTCISLFPEGGLGSQAFTDVPLSGRPREDEDPLRRRQIIYTAARYGIVEGYQDGSFKPDAPVTRAEALKILLAASQLSLHPTLESDVSLSFGDVRPDDWFAGIVNQAVRLRLIDGYEDGTFRPAASITRAEAAKLTHYILLGNPLVNGYVLPQDEEKEETPPASTGAIIET